MPAFGSASAVAPATNGAYGTTMTASLPASTADGDFLIMVAVNTSPESFADPTPASGSNRWNPVDGAVANGDLFMQIWAKVANSEPASYTITQGTTGPHGAVILRYTGADTGGTAGGPIAAQYFNNFNTGAGTAEGAPAAIANVATTDMLLALHAFAPNAAAALSLTTAPSTGGWNSRVAYGPTTQTPNPTTVFQMYLAVLDTLGLSGSVTAPHTGKMGQAGGWGLETLRLPAPGTITPGTITPVGLANQIIATAGTTLPFTTCALGNCVIAAFGNAVTGSTVVPSAVSGGNCSTWTQIGTPLHNATLGNISLWIGRNVNAVGDSPIVATWNGSVSGVGTEIYAKEFSAGYGANTVWTIDTTASKTNTSASTITYPTLVPTGTNELYFGYAVPNSASAASASGTTAGYAYTNMVDQVVWNPAISASTAPTGPISSAAISIAIAGLIKVAQAPGPIESGGLIIPSTQAVMRAALR